MLQHMSAQLRGDTALMIGTDVLSKVWYLDRKRYPELPCEFLAAVALHLRSAVYEAKERILVDGLHVLVRGTASASMRVACAALCSPWPRIRRSCSIKATGGSHRRAAAAIRTADALAAWEAAEEAQEPSSKYAPEPRSNSGKPRPETPKTEPRGASAKRPRGLIAPVGT